MLIAGDTHTMGRHLEIPARAARKYGCPVVLIWGNHEPYGSIWSELLADEERQLADLRADGLDIRVLHGAATETAGVRIIGATLWTDLNLYPELEELACQVVTQGLNDFRKISIAPRKLMTGEDIAELPFYDFWRKSAAGSGCPLHCETGGPLVWLHDWEACCQMFIGTGRHRWMSEEKTR